MTSEREIHQIAADEAREALRRYPALWENHPHLREGEWGRCADLIANYPILDLPVGDRDGTWWPLHGYAYGHIQRRGDRIIISRGEKPMHLTKGESLELAAILTAAAMEEP
ncbi:MAG TPA: hypothetical protein DCL06_06260 [Corynebacterium variabile]|uniref:Uncharacterized protein n=1 Tax=Corynebacterium variabile TaxID=1727 RepID=A0A3B9QUD7_9CORY|nr:hypothetical protein [Corynebacterium variabile]